MKSVLNLFKHLSSSLYDENRFNHLRVFTLKINLLRLSMKKHLHLTSVEGLKSIYVLSHSHSIMTAFLKRHSSGSCCLQTMNMRSEMRWDLKALVLDSDTVTAPMWDCLPHTGDLKLMLVMLKNRGQKDSLLTSESSILNSKDSRRVVLLRIWMMRRVKTIKKLACESGKMQVMHQTL